MTCKDCIHNDVCRGVYLAIQGNTKLTLKEFQILCEKEDFDNQDIALYDCLFFQDRSRFAELPQSVHLCDAVHFVLKGLDEIDLQEYTFTVGKNAVSDTVQFITEIGTYGFWVGESPREFAPDYDDFYYWYELGETVFLSREEAEQFLKERGENEK